MLLVNSQIISFMAKTFYGIGILLYCVVVSNNQQENLVNHVGLEIDTNVISSRYWLLYAWLHK